MKVWNGSILVILIDPDNANRSWLFLVFRTYFIVASRVVRPNQIYRVAVSILTSPISLSVRASILRNGVDIGSATQDCKPGIPETLLIKVRGCYRQVTDPAGSLTRMLSSIWKDLWKNFRIFPYLRGFFRGGDLVEMILEMGWSIPTIIRNDPFLFDPSERERDPSKILKNSFEIPLNCLKLVRFWHGSA